jgi:hypothetical protein
LWWPVLAALEPFALDLWRDDIGTWLPPSGGNRLCLHNFFGGLYQIISLRRGLAVSSRRHLRATVSILDASASSAMPAFPGLSQVNSQ